MAILPVIAAALLARPGRERGAHALVSDRRHHSLPHPRGTPLLLEAEDPLGADRDTSGDLLRRRRTALGARRKVAEDAIETDNDSAAVDERKSVRRGFPSSFLRSTSQTEALGGARRREEARDAIENRSSSSAADDEILRRFSLLVLSQFVLFLGVGAVIPTIRECPSNMRVSLAHCSDSSCAPTRMIEIIQRCTASQSASVRLSTAW